MSGVTRVGSTPAPLACLGGLERAVISRGFADYNVPERDLRIVRARRALVDHGGGMEPLDAKRRRRAALIGPISVLEITTDFAPILPVQ